MLSTKHLKSHGLTSKEYRKKHGLSARQPLCAKALSEKRSLSGKERGIPANLRKAIDARMKKKSPRNKMIPHPLLDSFSGEGLTFCQFHLPRQSVNPGFGAEQQSVGGWE